LLTPHGHKRRYAKKVGLNQGVINGWVRRYRKFGFVVGANSWFAPFSLGLKFTLGRRRRRLKSARSAWEYELYNWFLSLRGPSTFRSFLMG